LFVNQHRAHVAVLYQQFMEQIAHMQGSTQQLLFPEPITLSPDEIILLEHILPDLRAIGFELEQLTPDSYSVYSVPAQLVHVSPIPTLQHILSLIREQGADAQDEWRKQIAMALAENAAISYGKSLTLDEMRDLLQRLFQLSQVTRMPNGKKIVALFSIDDINKLF
jgi:DNA mismatch repair protein MutL